MDAEPDEAGAGETPDTDHPTTVLARPAAVIPRQPSTPAPIEPEPLSAGEAATSAFRAGEVGTSVFDPGEGSGTQVYQDPVPPPSTDLVPRPPAAYPAVAPAVGLPAPAAGPGSGWYADPWSNGQSGAMRYWDGAAWTAYSAQVGTAAGQAPQAVLPPRSLGVPGWVLGLWWFLVALVAVGVFFVVLMMSAFACDSGWEGCSTAVADGVSAYVIVTAIVATLPPILAVVIGRGRRLGRALRITALVLMPLAPLLGFGATLWLITSRVPQ